MSDIFWLLILPCKSEKVKNCDNEQLAILKPKIVNLVVYGIQ